MAFQWNANALRGVDLAVSTADYTSFHELLSAGVPTVFVPDPRAADDQMARARFAAAAGVALCAASAEELDRVLAEAADPAVRAELSRRCADVAFDNGAGDAADWIAAFCRDTRWSELMSRGRGIDAHPLGAGHGGRAAAHLEAERDDLVARHETLEHDRDQSRDLVRALRRSRAYRVGRALVSMARPTVRIVRGCDATRSHPTGIGPATTAGRRPAHPRVRRDRAPAGGVAGVHPALGHGSPCTPITCRWC